MDFEISVETINEVERSITIDIPRTIYDQRLNSALNTTASRAHLKGFRPGRAPRNMVLKMYGDDIRQEVMSSLLSLAYQKAVKEHDLKVVGSPQIDKIDDEQGKDLKVIAKVALLPQPVISDAKGLSFTVELQEVADADVEHQLEHVRERFVNHIPVEGRKTIEQEDVVQFDYELVGEETGGKDKKEGDSSKRGQTERFWVHEGQKPAELVEALVGKQIGEAFTVTLKVPASTAKKGVAPGTTEDREYSILPLAIMRRELPELTDALVKENKLGDNIADLKGKIRQDIQQRVDQENTQRRETALIEAIAEKNTFAIPQMMIDAEIRMIFAEMGLLDPRNPDSRNVDVAQFREGLGKQAEQRVRKSIILDRLLEQESVKATDAEVNDWVDQQSARAGVPRDQFLKSVGAHQDQTNLRYHVATQKLIAELLREAKVAETSVALPACEEHHS